MTKTHEAACTDEVICFHETPNLLFHHGSDYLGNGSLVAVDSSVSKAMAQRATRKFAFSCHPVQATNRGHEMRSATGARAHHDALLAHA